jgi:hypothetical protein
MVQGIEKQYTVCMIGLFQIIFLMDFELHVLTVIQAIGFLMVFVHINFRKMIKSRVVKTPIILNTLTNYGKKSWGIMVNKKSQFVNVDIEVSIK